jgi:serine/threonine-protein kinase
MADDSFSSNQGGALSVGQELGRYRVVRFLGSGGMAEVYEARHVDLGKRCALKTLRGEHASNPDVRARFLREGQAASRISHPNVVDVYDVASDGRLTYLVMEFLEGEDMAAYLKRHAPLSEQDTADLLVPIAAALSAAHHRGIVHRDIKPENVFLRRGKSGEVTPKVVDFGISKLVDTTTAHALTQTSAMLGTPQYMSPEQAKATKNVGFATDQYSLGVIAYEALTGKRPFTGDTIYILLHSIVSGEFVEPRKLVSVSPEFEEIVLRAMHGSPERRFPSMDAFGAALLPFASERIRLTFGGEFGGDEAHASTITAGTSPVAAVSSGPTGTAAGPGPALLDGGSSPSAQPGGTKLANPGGVTEAMDGAPVRTVASTVEGVGTSTLGQANGAIDAPARKPGGNAALWAGLALVVVLGGGAIIAFGRSGGDSTAAGAAVESADGARAAGAEPSSEAAEVSAKAESENAPPPASQATTADKPTSKTSATQGAAAQAATIGSNVEGAHVFVEGEDRGPVPVQLQIPDGQASLDFEVRAKGYQTAKHTLTEEDGNELTISLEKTPRRTSPPRPASTSRPATRPSLPELAPR